MNGNHLFSTHWANVAFSYWKRTLYGLHYNITIKFSFHGLIYLRFWDTTSADNHKMSIWVIIPCICPSLERWPITFTSSISSDPHSNIMRRPFWSPFGGWVNWTQRMKGLEQSPQDKKLDLSDTAQASKCVGWEEALRAYLEGDREETGDGAEKLHMDLSKLCICPTAMHCPLSFH